jgi:phosphoribosylaminoimidazole-succinocarboxamide synthase
MVASDRLSAFDVVLPDPIPGKGKVLTQMSVFWFRKMEPIVSNHVIATEVAAFPGPCQPYADALAGRTMLVKKADPLPVECIVRGYISGSGWKSYQASGRVCGIELPSGLKESDRLPEPIFTPSTKEEVGTHDVNIDFARTQELVGESMARRLEEVSLAIYKRAAQFAEERGIIIADTKFEFGLVDDQLVLIDEILTPDSSRFWPKATYQPGSSQKSFDKQYVRDYLLSINWDKKPPAPRLPAEVIENTKRKYEEALEWLTSS